MLERIDPTKKMARYYVLSIEATSFGNSALVREWRRIGFRGRCRSQVSDQVPDACVALDTWLARKVKSGYIARTRS